MVKKRIIASLTVKNDWVVQSIGFKKFLPVGTVPVCVEALNHWGVDEIIILDITASLEKRTINENLVQRACEKCFVPLTVGGGIKSVTEVNRLLQAGADKVVLNHAATCDHRVITDLANVFGSQCIIANIDVHALDNNHYSCSTLSNTKELSEKPEKLARVYADAGAGEILVNSIDRDGMKQGFDCRLIKNIVTAVDRPVIALGGAGSPIHFIELLQEVEGISGIAAGNFFHFFEHSVTICKAILKAEIGQKVRVDSYADYSEHKTDKLGRLCRFPEEVLLNRFFEFYPKEQI